MSHLDKNHAQENVLLYHVHLALQEDWFQGYAQQIQQISEKEKTEMVQRIYNKALQQWFFWPNHRYHDFSGWIMQQIRDTLSLRSYLDFTPSEEDPEAEVDLIAFRYLFARLAQDFQDKQRSSVASAEGKNGETTKQKD